MGINQLNAHALSMSEDLSEMKPWSAALGLFLCLFHPEHHWALNRLLSRPKVIRRVGLTTQAKLIKDFQLYPKTTVSFT